MRGEVRREKYEGRSTRAETYAYIRRPRGSGIGRPSRCAVSIHSAMIVLTFATTSSLPRVVTPERYHAPRTVETSWPGSAACKIPGERLVNENSQRRSRPPER